MTRREIMENDIKVEIECSGPSDMDYPCENSKSINTISSSSILV